MNHSPIIMKKTASLFLAALLLSIGIVSAETAIDDDFMRSVEDTHKSLTGNVGIGNAPGSIADAKELAGMFAQIEAYYVQKGDAPDAVSISKQSKDLSNDIQKLASSKDFETANLKATELSRACKACHNFYKKS